MRFGVLTDSLFDLSLDQALDLAQEVGASYVEFAGGSWSTRPHLETEKLLASEQERTNLLQKISDRGLQLSALNASGNQLHPAHPENDQITRDIIRLAGELGLDRVVLMSGLPGGAPGDSMPNWINTSWPPENADILKYQWEDVALPYWADLVKFAAEQGVTKLAIEMHANQLVYSVPTAMRLREEIGENVGVNFDPSHLIWMDADPFEAMRALGPAIFHVHAKDTRLEKAMATRSRLEYLPIDEAETRAWNYVTVGRGNEGQAFWDKFVTTLQEVGYDDVMSIEHEDVRQDGPSGIREAAGVLKQALKNSEKE